MSNVSTYPLRLPRSLKAGVTEIAKREGTSVNQFIAMAVAEKISALETERFFVDRAKDVDMEAFLKILKRPVGEKPQSGDEL